VSKNVRLTRYIVLLITVLYLLPAAAELADGQGKFLGNIVSDRVPANYSKYWNQITPENAGKWYNVELAQNRMSWARLDTFYNYAKKNGLQFKQHAFVWGAQEPKWLKSLSSMEQRKEIEEFIAAYCERYPDTDYIDVVNEPLHSPPSYKDAIGGDGATGWDWVVWAFATTRAHCPNAKLLINEYGVINDPAVIARYKAIVGLLKHKKLIDGIGIQAHAFSVDDLPPEHLQFNLDDLSKIGVPIYIAELGFTGDNKQQKQRYSEKFPILWNHPNVHGITLWGYLDGQTWINATHLVGKDGRERPAMQWLGDFFAGRTEVQIAEKPLQSTPPAVAEITGKLPTDTHYKIDVRVRGTTGEEQVVLQVADITVETWQVSRDWKTFSTQTEISGELRVGFINDGGERDVEVDYVVINGSKRLAADQSDNTGAWSDNGCGGGNFTGWMHCNGSIGFGPIEQTNTAANSPSVPSPSS